MHSPKKESDQLFSKIPSAGTKIQGGTDIERLITTLNKQYPHGHKDFNPMTLKEMKLHSEKNYDYAAGGDPLGNFNRVAGILGQYKGLSLSDPTVIALVYAMKQVDAALWMLSQKREGKIEDVNSRLGDVSVYVKLAMILHKQPMETANKPIKPVTETWALENAKVHDDPFLGNMNLKTEHECWGGWSDGEAVTCTRKTRQRDYKRDICEGELIK